VRAVAAFAVEGAAQPVPQPAAGAPGHGRLRRQRSGQNLQRACEIRLHERNVQVHGCITGESVKCRTDIIFMAWRQVCMRQD
jgi:hypothetical protein